MKKKLTKRRKKQQPKARGYDGLLNSLSLLSPDWAISGVSEDADIYRNNFVMRDRSRDSFRLNPYFIAFADEVRANVHGPKGIALRMKIKETEDRVVYAAEEKAALRAMQSRWDRVRAYVERKTGRPLLRERHFVRELDEHERTQHERAIAKVQVGELDIFANQLIERKWKEWQRKENCTVTGRLTYNESRQLRLHSAIRDGGHFIRMLRDGKFKPFGFKLQHINDEWCDFYFNRNEPGENEIRMGIEYDAFGAPVAFHFIERSARDWQFYRPTPTLGGTGPSAKHVRVPADEVIHYARFAADSDTTRPAPWAVGVMSNTRQLAKWVEAAVVAARVASCSNVFFESAVDGPDGTSAAQTDPTDLNKLQMKMTPGGMHGLPPGITAKAVNPNIPNANFGAFRKDMLREFCAGLPGACYSVIAADYESINFSAGRLDRLSTTGAWMMLQQFDIDAAERRIFEAWLEMALITGAVALPLNKFFKFNAPNFQGRRWEGVDEQKEVNARALKIANLFTSRARVVDESGEDFEEILFELAEENMMLEDFGMSTLTTATTVQQSAEEMDMADQNQMKCLPAPEMPPPAPINLQINVTPGTPQKQRIVRDENGRADHLEPMPESRLNLNGTH